MRRTTVRLYAGFFVLRLFHPFFLTNYLVYLGFPSAGKKSRRDENNANKNIVGDIFVLITIHQGAKRRSINR